MSEQTVINILFGTVFAGVGWWMRTLWDNQKRLEGKVAEIEVLVAGNYMPRPEFERSIDALFKKLDKIEDKLDRKADKP